MSHDASFASKAPRTYLDPNAPLAPHSTMPTLSGRAPLVLPPGLAFVPHPDSKITCTVETKLLNFDNRTFYLFVTLWGPELLMYAQLKDMPKRGPEDPLTTDTCIGSITLTLRPVESLQSRQSRGPLDPPTHFDDCFEIIDSVATFGKCCTVYELRNSDSNGNSNSNGNGNKSKVHIVRNVDELNRIKQGCQADLQTIQKQSHFTSFVHESVSGFADLRFFKFIVPTPSLPPASLQGVERYAEWNKITTYQIVTLPNDGDVKGDVKGAMKGAMKGATHLLMVRCGSDDLAFRVPFVVPTPDKPSQPEAAAYRVRTALVVSGPLGVINPTKFFSH